MNTDRTGASAGISTGDASGVPRSTRRRRGPRREGSGDRAAAETSRATLASVKPWTHTLIVTGELNGRSAAELEAEIETLFEEGVTGITLDLRKLEKLDAVGARVLAFRGGLCERRGYEFAVIPASAEMQVALTTAGVTVLLSGDDGADERSASSGRALVGPRVH